MAVVPTRSIDNVEDIAPSQAISIQRRLIKEWEPLHEVWPLKYGTEVISAFAGATGFTCNMMFRKSIRLMSHGYYTTTFLVSLVPALLTYMTHREFILDDLLIFRNNCLLCSQVKAVSAISINGFAYPLIMAPAITLPLAGNLGLRIPYIYEVKELARYFKLVLSANKFMLTVMFAGNALVASAITYKQFESMKTVEEVLLKIQNYMDTNNIEDWRHVKGM